MKKSIDRNFRYLVTTLCITCIETGEGFYNNFLCDSLDEVKEYLSKSVDREELVEVYDLSTGEKLNF
jgi:hypothetical protein